MKLVSYEIFKICPKPDEFEIDAPEFLENNKKFLIPLELLAKAIVKMSDLSQEERVDLGFSMPFKNMWIQDHSDRPLLNMTMNNGDLEFVVGLSFYELEPGRVGLTTLSHNPSTRMSNILMFELDIRNMEPKEEKFYIAMCAVSYLLNRNQWGREKYQIEERVKIGRKRHVIKKRSEIIHIRDAKYPHFHAPTKPNRIVEWDIRWEVRGHWRKIPGTGKNREGDYVIVGFTWVKEHTKGNVEAELTTKIRKLA